MGLVEIKHDYHGRRNGLTCYIFSKDFGCPGADCGPIVVALLVVCLFQGLSHRFDARADSLHLCHFVKLWTSSMLTIQLIRVDYGIYKINYTGS